jgi:hypothetical protein
MILALKICIIILFIIVVSNLFIPYLNNEYLNICYYMSIIFYLKLIYDRK